MIINSSKFLSNLRSVNLVWGSSISKSDHHVSSHQRRLRGLLTGLFWQKENLSLKLANDYFWQVESSHVQADRAISRRYEISWEERGGWTGSSIGDNIQFVIYYLSEYNYSLLYFPLNTQPWKVGISPIWEELVPDTWYALGKQIEVIYEYCDLRHSRPPHLEKLENSCSEWR